MSRSSECVSIGRAISTGPGAEMECAAGRFDPVGRSDRVTIAALLVWMCTAAAGGYLLATPRARDTKELRFHVQWQSTETAVREPAAASGQ